MEREVAIKVILEVALQLPEMKSRFYREARTAGKLTHDNITIIHDVGEDDGRPYIVMEYLPGRDLRSILEKREPLSLFQKLDFAEQIARGLAYSHSKDIVHRDVKPANIRIVDERKVKIMDFGIAKPMSSNLTATGAVIGTPYYMSPEQIQGKKVDRRTDIFSFGVLFYELLTYRKPFSGDEPTSVMYKIVHEDPEHLEELERAYPPKLRQVVMGCLRKDPAQRYQSLDEVADELENIIGELRSVDRKKLEEQRRKIEKILVDARGFLGKHRYKEAHEAVAKAVAIDPQNSQVLKALDEIKKAEEEEKRRARILEQITAARRLLTAKKYDAAIAAARAVLASAPEQHDALQIIKAANDAIAAASTPYAPTVVTDQIPQEETVVVGLPERPRPAVARKSRRFTPVWLAVSIGGILCIVGIGYRLLIYTPSPSTGYVSLNILPWAEISQITLQGGADVALKEKPVTPCRLSLPEGTYDIHLTNPSLQKSLVLTVSIKKDENQEIRKRMPGFEQDKLLPVF
jgi:serine/threonine-protein kinase